MAKVAKSSKRTAGSNKPTEPGDDDGLVKPGEKPTLQLEKSEGEKVGKRLAKMSLDPFLRNGHVAMAYCQGMFGDQHRPDIMVTTEAMIDEVMKGIKRNPAFASKFYASQAIALDAMFTELARRAAANMGTYPDAVDRYLRLAFKAQNACRTTLDSLGRLHQPQEQTVKHVHVGDGGQAVVADQFHAHTHPGVQHEKQDERAHDQHPEGPSSPALLGQDAEGNGVPLPSNEREAAVLPARRSPRERSPAGE